MTFSWIAFAWVASGGVTLASWRATAIAKGAAGKAFGWFCLFASLRMSHYLGTLLFS